MQRFLSFSSRAFFLAFVHQDARFATLRNVIWKGLFFCSSSRSSGNQQSQNVSPLLPPPFEKLPDASLLLSSPISSAPVGTDHSARVAAAMADNASRKREANGSSSSSTRVKIPRSNLPQTKNIPETCCWLLTPPQLRGRQVFTLLVSLSS